VVELPAAAILDEANASSLQCAEIAVDGGSVDVIVSCEVGD
jgi:hypothetical protein